jgi:hypothetical protein
MRRFTVLKIGCKIIDGFTNPNDASCAAIEDAYYEECWGLQEEMLRVVSMVAKDWGDMPRAYMAS